MATYVNDLRLKEITTGDESGTWGTSTNTNLELIAEAFSYGTEVITTNADTHTTTIADGSTDPGRSLYLKYTGTLDSACTITIGPNTVSKVWIIENGTSGSQDIILSQGSGANITIPAGDTKVVYSDGAGAGAAFFDAFASLSVVDLKVQDDLTVTGDITGTLATAAQPNITSVGTLTGFTSTGIDDNADATAITIDSDENVGIGYASPNAKFVVGTASGQNIEFFPENATDTNLLQNYDRTASAYQKIETRAAEHIFSIGSSEKIRIDSSGNVGIGTSSPSAPLDVTGVIKSASATQSSLYLSNAARTTGFLVGRSLSSNDAQDFFIYDGTAAATRLSIDSSGNVGIGLTNPSDYYAENLVVAAAAEGGITIKSAATDHGYLMFADGTSGNEAYRAYISHAHDGDTTNLVSFGSIGLSSVNETTFSTNSIERMRIAANGNVGIGTSSPTQKFVIKGNSTAATGFGLIVADSVGTDLFNVRNDGAIFTGGGANSPRYLTTATAANLVVETDGYLYKSTSSRRYKNTITDATHGLTELLTLRPVTYKGNGKIDGDTVFGGLIAEEVHDAGLTEFVVYNEENEPDALAYSNMVSLCVKAIQEQQTIIESLTARITTLEG
jgi:hypothetical protein